MNLEFNWCKDSNLLEIKSEKIKKNRVINFVKSSLFLNNITYNKTDKIYLLFVKEKSLYQILVFNETFDASYLECFKITKILDEEKIVLFIHQHYLVIYKNKNLYYFQKINYEIDDENRVKEHLESKLNIQISKVLKISEDELFRYINDFKKLKIKSSMQNLNQLKNSFYKVYALYVVLVFILTFYAIGYSLNSKKTTPILKTIKYEKFLSFNEKYLSFLQKIKKYKLKLELFSYDKENLKINFSSKRKKDLYAFLLEYKNKVKKSSISYVKDKGFFYCEVELRSI